MHIIHSFNHCKCKCISHFSFFKIARFSIFLPNGFLNFKYVRCYLHVKNNDMHVIFFIICINCLDYISRRVHGQSKARNRLFFVVVIVP